MSEQSEELRMVTAIGRIAMTQTKAEEFTASLTSAVEHLEGCVEDMEFLADQLESFYKESENLVERIRNRAEHFAGIVRGP